MILLYISFTALLLTALAAAFGWLVQADAAYHYERLFACIPSRAALRLQARHERARARLAMAIFGAAMLCWVAWLIWGLG